MQFGISLQLSLNHTIRLRDKFNSRRLFHPRVNVIEICSQTAILAFKHKKITSFPANIMSLDLDEGENERNRT